MTFNLRVVGLNDPVRTKREVWNTAGGVPDQTRESRGGRFVNVGQHSLVGIDDTREKPWSVKRASRPARQSRVKTAGRR